MEKIVALPPLPPNEAVIRACESMLACAKRGELRGFIAAAVLNSPDDPGTSVSGWRAGCAPIASLVWSLERAKLKLMGFVEDQDIDLSLSGL